jgi:Uma2 family endonuclease
MATDLPLQPDAAGGDAIALLAPAAGVHFSSEAFWKLCQLNPDLNFERNADGSIVVMTPAGGGSARRSGQVYGQLFMWAMKDGTGEPFDATAGFTLPNGAVRSPDASWVLSSRWNALTEAEQEAFPRIAPDFVAEVRSKSDSLVELRRKMKEYVEQGVRLAWLIDPESRLVEIYRPGAGAGLERGANQRRTRIARVCPGACKRLGAEVARIVVAP